MKAISFTAENIRAYQRGEKTQTRRVMRPQPQADWRWDGERWHVHKGYPVGHVAVPCPYGTPGDVLGFLEGYQITGAGTCAFRGVVRGRYLSDRAPFEVELAAQELAKWERRKWPYRATPGRFMYRSLVRYKPQILNVCVERVQDISEGDARAEGVAPMVWISHPENEPAYRVMFQPLWDSINAKRGYGWEVNPWVWCIEFEKGDQ